MFTPPEAYHPARREDPPPPPVQTDDDHLAPIWLRLIDGIHDLSSKGFFISTAFFISLGARIIPDAVIIQIALLVLTVIFFWIQKPYKGSQRDIRERRLTGLYIFASTLLINWDAGLLMFFRPVELGGKIFKLWQWLGFGVMGLIVIGLIVAGFMAAPQEQEQRYF
jgi:hypothetical protein